MEPLEFRLQQQHQFQQAQHTITFFDPNHHILSLKPAIAFTQLVIFPHSSQLHPVP